MADSNDTYTFEHTALIINGKNTGLLTITRAWGINQRMPTLWTQLPAGTSFSRPAAQKTRKKDARTAASTAVVPRAAVALDSSVSAWAARRPPPTVQAARTAQERARSAVLAAPQAGHEKSGKGEGGAAELLVLAMGGVRRSSASSAGSAAAGSDRRAGGWGEVRAG